MSTDKTLADVQPGGRVRLGDQAERARFEAWAQSKMNISRWKDGKYMSRYVQEKWEIWQAALSAHPSPGGQDAPERCAECRHTTFEVHPDGHICVHCKLIVAARQPVGQEPVVTAEMLAAADAYHDSEEYRSGQFSDSHTNAACYRAMAAAAPPAQPAGEPVAWLIERLRGKGYGRDKYVVMNGQASSDPDSHLFWTDQQARDNHRVTPLYANPPAQAVDLEQFRPAVCAMGLYAEEPEDVDEAKRLLALIDSQDRPNG